MRKDYKGLVSLVFALGLVMCLLIGLIGIIWYGAKISTQGSVVIGMLTGAIVIVASAYLGIYLTYVQNGTSRPRWPGERDRDEDTLVK